MSILTQDIKKTLTYLFYLTLLIAPGILLTLIRHELGIFYFELSLLLLFILLGFFRPIYFLYILIIFSIFSPLIRSLSFLEIGSTFLTISGFGWSLFLISLIFITIFNKKIYFPKNWKPVIFFLIWIIVNWGLYSFNFRGLKDILWYSAPILAMFGSFQLLYKYDHEGLPIRLKTLEKIFFFSIGIYVITYLAAFVFGLIHYTSYGPRGQFLNDARGIPLFFLIILAVSLANWRYGPSRSMGMALSFLSIGFIFFNLARIAMFSSVLLLFTHKLNPRRKWQILVSTGLVIIIIFLLVQNIPLLRKRFFLFENWNLEQGLKGVKLSGRDFLWSTTLKSALKSPYLGQGVGSARKVVAQALSEEKGVDIQEYHPHNDYLQIFHDLGGLGLILFLFFWGAIFFHTWREWEFPKNIQSAKWNMLASLCIIGLFISALTDNSFHYPFLTVPVGIIIACANFCSQNETL